MEAFSVAVRHPFRDHRGIGGALNGPSGYYMKSPPLQFTDDEARELVEAFIRGDEEIAIQPRDGHAGGGKAPKVGTVQQKNV